MGGVTDGVDRREPCTTETTVLVSFRTDAFAGYEEHIGACSSVEFAWRVNGSRSGWRAAGVGERYAGAVPIELPVERRFEAGLADRFAVLVTDEGVSEVDPDASLPPCDGAPPE